jgi:hypothetical protein
VYCASATPWSAAQSEPARCFGVVLRHAVAVAVLDPEADLRLGVSLFGTRPQRVGSLWLNLSTFTTAKSG